MKEEIFEMWWKRYMEVLGPESAQQEPRMIALFYGLAKLFFEFGWEKARPLEETSK